MIRMELDPGLRDALDKIGDGAFGRVLSKLEAEADRRIADAESRWPIGRRREGAEAGRPHSKDLFQRETRITEDSVSVVISNPAKYAYKIKTYQSGLGGKSPWQELVRKPFLKDLKRIATEVEADLNKLRPGGR